MIWITGASGDLGQELTRQCATHSGDNLSTARVDVTNFEAVESEFKKRIESKGPPRAVFHCAVYVELSKTESNPSHTIAVNTLGTTNVLRALEKLNLKPWTCIVSSGHSYAPVPKPQRLNEQSVVAPRSAYALSKLHAEQFATFIAERANIPLFIPRIFSFTAPWQRQSFVLPRLARLIREAKVGEPLQTGWLGAYRDFLDIRDVCAALLLAQQKQITGLFNICRGEPTQIRELAKILLEMHGLQSLEIKEGSPRPDDIEWMIGDPSKFTQATKFQPSYSIAETLRDTLAFQANPASPPR